MDNTILHYISTNTSTAKYEHRKMTKRQNKGEYGRINTLTFGQRLNSPKT